MCGPDFILCSSCLVSLFYFGTNYPFDLIPLFLHHAFGPLNSIVIVDCAFTSACTNLTALHGRLILVASHPILFIFFGVKALVWLKVSHSTYLSSAGHKCYRFACCLHVLLLNIKCSSLVADRQFLTITLVQSKG